MTASADVFAFAEAIPLRLPLRGSDDSPLPCPSLQEDRASGESTLPLLLYTFVIPSINFRAVSCAYQEWATVTCCS